MSNTVEQLKLELSEKAKEITLLKQQIFHLQENVEFLQQQNDLMQLKNEESVTEAEHSSKDQHESVQFQSKQPNIEQQDRDDDKKQNSPIKVKRDGNKSPQFNYKKSMQVDKEAVQLKLQVRKLEIELSQSKKYKGTSEESKSPIAKMRSLIPQQKSSSLHTMLISKGATNFSSSYLEINRSKFDNVKLIKQLKNGFERSCFDSHHFDFIDYDAQKARSYLDKFHAIGSGNGLYDTNHLIIIYGASRTNKKPLLVQLMDMLLKQFKLQYDIFYKNPDFDTLNITFNTCERMNNEIKHDHNLNISLQKSKTISENDKQSKDFELFVQRIKLHLLNRVKAQNIKKKSHEKVREYQIEVEKYFGNDSINSKLLLYSSSIPLGPEKYQYTEEALRDILIQSDNGRSLAELFTKQSINPLTFNLILNIHPTVPQYKITSNAFRLLKLCRLPNKQDSNQPSPLKEQDDRYSTLLENQLKGNELLQRNQQFKTGMQKQEIDNLKRQLEFSKRSNQDLEQKNLQFKNQLEALSVNLEQVYTTVNQQLNLKQKKFLTRGQYLKKNPSILTFEKASRILNNVLYKCNGLKESNGFSDKKKLTRESQINQDSEADVEEVDADVEEVDEDDDDDDNDDQDDGDDDEIDLSQVQNKERNESII